MKALTIHILSATILLFGATAANGQAKPEQRSEKSAEQVFDSLDRNRDRDLSKVEAKADPALAAAFASADTNLNGYISKPEYIAYVQLSAAPREPPTR